MGQQIYEKFEGVCNLKQVRKILLDLPHIRFSCYCAVLCGICIIISFVLSYEDMSWLASLFLSIGTSLITGIVVCWITNLRSNVKLETESTIEQIKIILEYARKIKQLRHRYTLAQAYKVTVKDCKKDADRLREYAEGYTCNLLVLEAKRILNFGQCNSIDVVKFYGEYNEAIEEFENGVKTKAYLSIKDVFLYTVKLDKIISPSYSYLNELHDYYVRQKYVLDTKPF